MISDRIFNRVTLRQLRTVLEVGVSGSLARAAERLSVTQPTVTKAIQEIEANIGVELFERTNRGVVPTRYGDALLRHGKLVMAQLSQATDEISHLKGGTGGHVVVGTLLAAATRLLPDALAGLQASRPGLSIAVMEGTNDFLMPKLRAGELDCVVGRLPEFRERAGLVQEALLEDSARVVAKIGHPLLRSQRIGLADTLRYRWILPRPETTLRRQVEKDFRDSGLEPPGAAIESVSPMLVRRLLLLGDYLAVWPLEVASIEASLGLVATLDLELPSTRGPIGITIRRGHDLSPAALALVDALRGAARVARKPVGGR